MGKQFSRRRAIALGVWLASASAAGVLAQQESADDPAPASESSVPARFTGSWDYNDDESINAGTGRREQVPQSATARSASNNAPAPSRGASGGGGSSNSSGIYVAQPTVTASMIRDTENFVRDMLEVPELLQIRASDSEVTFVDDLSRERTYPTDGKGRDYWLSASKYEAKVLWDGPQLKREIEGGIGFKVFETYFLSDDGERLFVILRVKAPKRPGFVAGFNRVYDRVSTPESAAR